VVLIQLYEDFQCPACAQFVRETYPDLVERYVEPGDTKLVAETLAFLGPDSVATARAALAAGEQDRYWNYGTLPFLNQGPENSGYATDEFLTGLAKETRGLDVSRWNEARDSGSIESELKAVQERARAAGVESTPTLVISGPGGTKKLVGAAPLEEVEAAIEEVEGS
jgi:protein-disulfide isomerase